MRSGPTVPVDVAGPSGTPHRRLGARIVAGVVLHSGSEDARLGDRIISLPISAQWYLTSTVDQALAGFRSLDRWGLAPAQRKVASCRSSE